MGTREENLAEALDKQFKALTKEGLSPADRKTEAEAYKILYDLSMAQDKAKEDTEFRESEMVLKETNSKLEQDKFELEQSRFEEDQKKNEREAKLRKFDTALKGVSVVGGTATSIGGLCLYRKGFKELLFNDTSTINVIAQRPFMYLKNLTSLAATGARLVIH